jgi:FKBP-type peptidyl-prolyl cis-trans isomerase
LIYADLRVGSGEEAKVGSKATLQWVLRKSNGYFVDSSDVVGVPFIFKIGDPNGAIVGVDEGIRGMRMGGTRRLLIPVNQGYVQGLDDDKPGPMPQGFGPRQQMRRVQGVRKDVPGEYIFIEVQLTRVR